MNIEPQFVTLSEPVKRGETVIEKVEIKRPTVGALRGLQMATVQMQDVNALLKLLPRITEPSLTPDEVAALELCDFTELANRVSVFLMTPAQRATVMTA